MLADGKAGSIGCGISANMIVCNTHTHTHTYSFSC